MVLLQSNEHYTLFVELNSENMDRKFKEYSRRRVRKKVQEKINGFFSEVGNDFLAIYSEDGKFFLVFNKDKIELKDDEFIEVFGPRDSRTLIVKNINEIIYEIKYSLADIDDEIPGDPTPFVEKEHFDIGLLASNISKSKVRRKIFTTGEE